MSLSSASLPAKYPPGSLPEGFQVLPSVEWTDVLPRSAGPPSMAIMESHLDRMQQEIPKAMIFSLKNNYLVSIISITENQGHCPGILFCFPHLPLGVYDTERRQDAKNTQLLFPFIYMLSSNSSQPTHKTTKFHI